MPQPGLTRDAKPIVLYRKEELIVCSYTLSLLALLGQSIDLAPSILLALHSLKTMSLPFLGNLVRSRLTRLLLTAYYLCAGKSPWVVRSREDRM